MSFEIQQTQHPPVLVLMDLVRSAGQWDDFMSLQLFEQVTLSGRIYVLLVDEKPIGFFALTNLVPFVSIEECLYIYPDYQRRWATRERIQKIKQLAQEVAFKEFEVQRIVGYVQEDSEASRRLTEHFGMQCEGRLRNCKRVNGKWKNLLIYSLLYDQD